MQLGPGTKAHYATGHPPEQKLCPAPVLAGRIASQDTCSCHSRVVQRASITRVKPAEVTDTADTAREGGKEASGSLRVASARKNLEHPVWSQRIS